MNVVVVWQEPLVSARGLFDLPSNAFNLTAEYATINCRYYLPYVTAMANGQTGTVAVSAGSPVTFHGIPAPDHVCCSFQPWPIYLWAIEGTWHWGQTYQHAFPTSGQRTVVLQVECAPDLLLAEALGPIFSLGLDRAITWWLAKHPYTLNETPLIGPGIVMDGSLSTIALLLRHGERYGVDWQGQLDGGITGPARQRSCHRAGPRGRPWL